MKRIVVWTVVCALLLCSCGYSGQRSVYVAKEKSTFVDYNVDNGMVHILCEITLVNATNTDQKVSVFGYSHEDADNGLLSNALLTGINTLDDSKIFTIEAKETKTFIVDFVGEYGGNCEKIDRMPPDCVELDILP